jgi:hypothetical protein
MADPPTQELGLSAYPSGQQKHIPNYVQIAPAFECTAPTGKD